MYMYSNLICVVMLWPKIKLYKVRDVTYTFNKNIIYWSEQCETFMACGEGEIFVKTHTHSTIYTDDFQTKYYCSSLKKGL